MVPTNKITSEKSNWSVYRPSVKRPWNILRVKTLWRRAGFGATWNEIQRDLNDGPKKSIDRMLSGKSRSEGVSSDFKSVTPLLGNAAVNSRRPGRLKAWWLYQMVFTPDPLTERLAIMWHNHFATSNQKVKNLELMREQNDIFRLYGRGSFPELLAHVIKHPAMLGWLDAETNRKGRPNENLARELLELFTVGVSNFKEKDVRDASRALTGWTVAREKFFVRQSWHDGGAKTVLGHTSQLSGDDLLRIVVEHPGTSNRLAWRLCDTFFGENVVSKEAMAELAKLIFKDNLNIEKAVETILQSELFFSDENIASQVASPEVFIVGTLRALEILDPPPSTLILAEWLSRMGRDLFYPPNVGGWPGGRTWLNTQSTIARANFGVALSQGKLVRPVQIPDFKALIEKYFESSELRDEIDFLAKLLTQNDISDLVEPIVKSVAAIKGGRNAQLADAVVRLLAHPNAHLV